MPAELSRTTRMPNGVTNAAPRQTMGNAGFPDPTWARIIALEYINALDITALTEAGAATFAAGTAIGGSAVLTTGAAAGTLGAASTPAVFQAPTTSNGLGRMFFKWQGSIDSLLGTILVGFVASAVAAPAQGIYIQSVVTTGALNLVVKNAAGTSTFPFPSNLALVAGTSVELGIEVDYEGNVFAYFNPTTGPAPTNTNGTVSNGPVVAAYIQIKGALTGLFLPTVALAATQGATPSTAVARALTVNFFVAAQEIVPN